MKNEQDLIPFNCNPLPKGPWLVFAPHPDDETFGMGGSLILAKEQGINIHLVIMTDGALGSQEEKPALVALRKQEVETVAHAIGAKVTYLDQPDRELSLSNALISHIENLIGQEQNASVFFPALTELHPDHRVTAQLVWTALQRSSNFSGQIFAYDISVQGPVNYYIDTTPVVDKKRLLMELYPSQLAENDYIEVVEALDRARSYTLGNKVKAAEGYYEYTSCDTPLKSELEKHMDKLWDNTDSSHKEEQLNQTINHLKEANEKLSSANQEILNSTSWKVTKPLRALKRVLRRG